MGRNDDTKTAFLGRVDRCKYAVHEQTAWLAIHAQEYRSYDVWCTHHVAVCISHNPLDGSCPLTGQWWCQRTPGSDLRLLVPSTSLVFVPRLVCQRVARQKFVQRELVRGEGIYKTFLSRGGLGKIKKKLAEQKEMEKIIGKNRRRRCYTENVLPRCLHVWESLLGIIYNSKDRRI